jgi:hypothetical protein
MKSLGLSRYALAMGAAAALLAGCGGSQPPIGKGGFSPGSAALDETKAAHPTISKDIASSSGAGIDANGTLCVTIGQ